jgi:CubicO group peptidase (beta-lactamase class C family)
MRRALRTVLVLLVPVLTARALPAAEPHVAASLQPFVDNHTLAGAVTLVATKDKILSLETVGYADIGAKTPMRTDDLFWIASMSKAMTAAGLMMLVDEGKVKLDDPVEKYLPEFKDQQVKNAEKNGPLQKLAHPITIRNILSHTSGLAYISPQEHPSLDMLPLAEAVRGYSAQPLEFQSDSKWSYSNEGINTAGRIIEVVSGMPYQDFMQKRLFDPLGMKDTTFWPSEEQVKRLAKSYKPGKDNKGLEELDITYLHYPLTDPKRQPMPAGGLFSTATDMAAFCQMLLNGGAHAGKRLLSEDSVRQMTSTQTGELLDKGRGENGYGLGLSTTRKAREGAVIPGPCGHGGAYATNMWIDPKRGLITVFMVQHAGYPGKEGGKVRDTFEKAVVETFGK